ncbi:MarR family winged helix-turn-helix transcriptional regulator [Haloechinothrix salitolerans]|uniref:MarR family winged helix-turn-helix transcriptional regulator n=1 Tax=Haloechinothrix salitolerans TaxID=926830 RepID=A0ABW2BV38_9PSEU
MTELARQEELDVADDLGVELVRTIRLLAKAKAKLSSIPGSADHSSFPIIATLVCEGPRRTSALAEALHTEVSTISRQTSALVQQGLIERQADPNDGRACLLAPTAAGRELYELARQERNRWLAATLRDWDADDVERLIGLLTRLNIDLADNLGASHDPTRQGEKA